MSGAPIISGTNQLPKPPIVAGMTTKNTMIRPCAVISTFQVCSAWSMSHVAVEPAAEICPRIWMPGSASSQRISPEIAPPMTPAKIENIR